MSFAEFATAANSSTTRCRSRRRAPPGTRLGDMKGRPRCRWRPTRAPRPSALTAWPKRRIRRGRRATRPAPARARCRCPPPCGAGRFRGRRRPEPRGRSRRAVRPSRGGGRRSRRPSRARPARAVEAQRQLDVGFAGGPVDLRGAAHARRSIDSVHRKALGTRQCGARGREAGGGLAGQGYASHPPPERGRRERWKRAAPPVGSTWLEPAT